MNSVEPFNPNSWPRYPGIGVENGRYVPAKTTQADLDRALQELRLEDAKFACYDVHASQAGRAAQMLRIVEVIVQLNSQSTPLSNEHNALRYTLQAAYEFCGMIRSMSQEVANRGLKLVAAAFEQQNNFCQAYDTGYDREGTLVRWKAYIDERCPLDQKNQQQFWLDFRKANLAEARRL